jgi:hypothetical protein
MILDSFLGLVESQLRLLAYVARVAPTQAIRADFDKTLRLHQGVAKTLREALTALANSRPRAVHPPGALRGAQEEEFSGDLRGQIESAMRAATEGGHAIRQIILSHTGLRHLRDQGLLGAQETTILDTPVVVDFSWDAPGFALQSFDAIPLEEIVSGAEASSDARA